MTINVQNALQCYNNNLLCKPVDIIIGGAY